MSEYIINTIGYNSLTESDIQSSTGKYQTVNGTVEIPIESINNFSFVGLSINDTLLNIDPTSNYEEFHDVDNGSMDIIYTSNGQSKSITVSNLSSDAIISIVYLPQFDVSVNLYNTITGGLTSESIKVDGGAPFKYEAPDEKGLSIKGVELNSYVNSVTIPGQPVMINTDGMTLSYDYIESIPTVTIDKVIDNCTVFLNYGVYTFDVIVSDINSTKAGQILARSTSKAVIDSDKTLNVAKYYGLEISSFIINGTEFDIEAYRSSEYIYSSKYSNMRVSYDAETRKMYIDPITEPLTIKFMYSLPTNTEVKFRYVDVTDNGKEIITEGHLVAIGSNATIPVKEFEDLEEIGISTPESWIQGCSKDGPAVSMVYEDTTITYEKGNITLTNVTKDFTLTIHMDKNPDKVDIYTTRKIESKADPHDPNTGITVEIENPVLAGAFHTDSPTNINLTAFPNYKLSEGLMKITYENGEVDERRFDIKPGYMGDLFEGDHKYENKFSYAWTEIASNPTEGRYAQGGLLTITSMEFDDTNKVTRIDIEYFIEELSPKYNLSVTMEAPNSMYDGLNRTNVYPLGTVISNITLNLMDYKPGIDCEDYRVKAISINDNLYNITSRVTPHYERIGTDVPVIYDAIPVSWDDDTGHKTEAILDLNYSEDRETWPFTSKIEVKDNIDIHVILEKVDFLGFVADLGESPIVAIATNKSTALALTGNSVSIKDESGWNTITDSEYIYIDATDISDVDFATVSTDTDSIKIRKINIDGIQSELTIDSSMVPIGITYINTEDSKKIVVLCSSSSVILIDEELNEYKIEPINARVINIDRNNHDTLTGISVSDVYTSVDGVMWVKEEHDNPLVPTGTYLKAICCISNLDMIVCTDGSILQRTKTETSIPDWFPGPVTTITFSKISRYLTDEVDGMLGISDDGVVYVYEFDPIHTTLAEKAYWSSKAEAIHYHNTDGRVKIDGADVVDGIIPLDMMPAEALQYLKSISGTKFPTGWTSTNVTGIDKLTNLHFAPIPAVYITYAGGDKFMYSLDGYTFNPIESNPSEFLTDKSGYITSAMSGNILYLVTTNGYSTFLEEFDCRMVDGKPILTSNKLIGLDNTTVDVSKMNITALNGRVAFYDSKYIHYRTKSDDVMSIIQVPDTISTVSKVLISPAHYMIATAETIAGTNILWHTNLMEHSWSMVTSHDFIPKSIFTMSDAFICASTDGMMYSIDGLSWEVTNNKATPLIAVSEDHMYAIRVDETTGNIGYSTDGITWSTTVQAIHDYMPDSFIIAGGKVIALSIDGTKVYTNENTIFSQITTVQYHIGDVIRVMYTDETRTDYKLAWFKILSMGPATNPCDIVEISPRDGNIVRYFSGIYDHPTTVEGYGIEDLYTKEELKEALSVMDINGVLDRLSAIEIAQRRISDMLIPSPKYPRYYIEKDYGKKTIEVTEEIAVVYRVPKSDYTIITDKGGNTFVSTDNITWIPWTLKSRHGYITDIIYTTHWLATTSTGYLYKSMDGVHWTSTSITTNSLNSIAYSGTNYVVVGNKCALVSTDGDIWTDIYTSIPSGTSFDLNYATYINGYFYTDGIFRSKDGIQWEKCVTPTGVPMHIKKILYVGILFIALANDSTILTSNDGSEWVYDEEILTEVSKNTNLVDMDCDGIGRCFIIADKSKNIYVYNTDLELQNTIPNSALIINAMTYNNGILTLLNKENMSYVNIETKDIRRCIILDHYDASRCDIVDYPYHPEFDEEVTGISAIGFYDGKTIVASDNTPVWYSEVMETKWNTIDDDDATMITDVCGYTNSNGEFSILTTSNLGTIPEEITHENACNVAVLDTKRNQILCGGDFGYLEEYSIAEEKAISSMRISGSDISDMDIDNTGEYLLASSKHRISRIDLDSVDGTISANMWKQVDSGVTTNLNSAAGSEDIIVVVGDEGVILTSTDGTNWVSQTSPTTSNLNKVIYTDKFIAVGDNSTIITSNDAITWERYSTIGSYKLRGITYNNGTYLAVGNECIYKSTDGTTWDIITSVNTAVYLTDMIYDDKFIGVGIDGMVLTSNDGDTWEFSGIEDVISCIANGNNIYTAIAPYTDGCNIVHVSKDATIWSTNKIYTDNKLMDIAFGDMFMAVGDNGTAYSSSDGIEWRQIVTPTTNNLNSIQFGHKLYIAVGDNGTILLSAIGYDSVMYNADSDYTSICHSMTRGESTWTSVENSSVDGYGIIYSFNNGDSWNRATLPDNYDYIGKLCANDNLIIAGAYKNDQMYVLTSADGTVWVEHPVPESYSERIPKDSLSKITSTYDDVNDRFILASAATKRLLVVYVTPTTEDVLSRIASDVMYIPQLLESVRKVAADRISYYQSLID